MARAVAATRYGELNGKIQQLLLGTSAFVDGSSFEVRRLLVEIEKLAKVNAAESSACRSQVAMCLGDVDESLRWSANLRALGDPMAGAACEMIAYSNLGYFSASLASYREIIPVESGQSSVHLGKGLICAAFSDLISAAFACERAKIELSNEAKRALEIAMTAQAVLHRLGVSEADVAAMLDVAGEVLRERRLFWLEPNPRVRVVDDDDGASLLYEFLVGVPVGVASEMTDIAIERIVERELDRSGVAVAFASHKA